MWKSILLFILLSLFILPSLFLKSYYLEEEPRETLSTLYMLKNKEYLSTRNYSQEIQITPPLLHWLQIGFFKMTGKINEGVSRLPSASFAILFLVSFYLFLTKFSSKRIAFYSVIVLLGCFKWYQATQIASIDMVFSCLTGFSFLLFYLYELSYFRKSIYLFLISILLSAAVLSKGLIGVFLPMIIFFIYMKFNFYSFFKIFIELSFLLLSSMIIPISWYLLTYNYFSGDFTEIILGESIVQILEGIKNSYSILYTALLFGIFPWSLVLIEIFFKKIKFFVKIKEYKKLDDLSLYSLIIILVFFLFFVISRSSQFLLPVYPFIAYGIALIANRIELNRLRVSQFVFSFSILFFIFLSYLIYLEKINLSELITKNEIVIEANYYKEYLSYLFSPTFLTIITAIAFLSFINLFYYRFYLFIINYLFILFLFSYSLVPFYSSLNSDKRIIKLLPKDFLEADRVYAFNHRFYGVNFYLDSKLANIKERTKKEKEIYLILKEKNFSSFKKELSYKFKIIYKKRVVPFHDHSSRNILLLKLVVI